MLRFTNNIIAQMTLACNKHCTYCYEHIDEKNPHDKTPMSFEVFKKYFDYALYNRCILGNVENVLEWHFHGGEVFLLPWPTLRKMIAYIEERQEFFPNVDYCFQTNGTLVTDEIAYFLKSRNKMIGFSFDSYADDARGTKEENEKLMQHMKDVHERTGAPCSYISVISRKNKDTWLLDWKKNASFCQEIGLNALCEVTDEDALTPLEVWECWYKPVLESYVSGDIIPERNVKIMLNFLISNLFFHIKTPDKTGCFSRRCGNGSNMIALTSKGDLSPCDKFLEKGEFIDKRFKMNVRDPDFLGLKNVRYVYHFCKELFQEENKLGCDTCPAKMFCIGDCQSYNISRYGKVKLSPNYCYTYKNFYEYVISHLRKIVLNKKCFEVGSERTLKSLGDLTAFGCSFLQDNPDIKIEISNNGQLLFKEKENEFCM